MTPVKSLQAFAERRALELIQYADLCFPGVRNEPVNLKEPPQHGYEINPFLLRLFSHVRRNGKLSPSEVDCFAHRTSYGFRGEPRIQETLYDFMCATYAEGFSHLGTQSLAAESTHTKSQAQHADGCTVDFHAEGDAHDGKDMWAIINWRGSEFRIPYSGTVAQGETFSKAPYFVQSEVLFRLNSAYYFILRDEEPKRYCKREPLA